ncbi:hypothetical protein MMC25_007066 [Agyrium rufum]|nr:hypothetical protein [Agyrium rufum]
MSLCRICNSAPQKYKCPTCKTPYCSILCYKSHLPSHSVIDPTNGSSKPANPPPLPTIAPLQSITNNENSSDGPPTGRAEFLHINTYSILETSASLQYLLKRYPNLCSQLRRIYTSTLPPSDELDPASESASDTENEQGQDSKRRHSSRGGYRGRGSRGRGRGRGRDRGRGGRGGHDGRDRSEGQWDEHHARTRALASFKRLREENEGLKEFSELAAKIMWDVREAEEGKRGGEAEKRNGEEPIIRLGDDNLGSGHGLEDRKMVVELE